MGRRNTRWTSSEYEVFVLGEQLRKQMHKQGLVKDRRHHLRKHKLCFVGRDVIDWLLKMHHVQSRDDAISALQILHRHGLFHHVTDEHDFRDHNSLYRFSFDDNTYRVRPELASFYWGLDVYQRLKAGSGDVMQEFYLKGTLYEQAFLGCDLVDFLLVAEGEENRDLVVARLRDLLQRDIIKHVTDDYHFNDDKLIYEFSLDFDRPCLLQDLLDGPGLDPASDSLSTSGSQQSDSTSANENTAIGEPSTGNSENSGFLDSESCEATGGETMSNHRTPPAKEGEASTQRSHRFKAKTAVTRPVTVKELEDPNSSYIKSILQIERDSVGFGFVLRGSAPCYVQTVEALGPAAASGMKTGQYLAQINAQSVLSWNHTQVGQLVVSQSSIRLTVLTLRCREDAQDT